MPTVTHPYKRLRSDAERPNILFLMTDQQRYDTVRATGATFMQTEHLDRLAAEGCLCTHAYSPNPICIAVRQNIITGLPARYHGFTENYHVVPRTDLPELPRLLSDAGYRTEAIGKMHYVPARRHHGFDRMQLMEEMPYCREDDDYALYLQRVGLGHIQNPHGLRNLLQMLPQRSLVPEEHHPNTWVADRCIEFLRRSGRRDRFFLFASWTAPHPPFSVVDRVADLYKGAPIPEPYGPSLTPFSSLAWMNSFQGDLPTAAYVRRMRELYCASVTHVDQNIGRVLAALEEIGQMDNTLIIFFSDHGEMLGDHGFYTKALPYEGSVHVPFIVRFPRSVAPGTQRHDFVDHNDLLPTVLDAAGVAYPGDIALPGESLLQPAGRKDRSLQYMEYSQDNKRWVSVRDHRYKYSYYYGGGREELFDMVADPQELTNLLADGVPDHLTAVRERLRGTLLAMEERWGLEGYVVGGEFQPFPPFTPGPKRNNTWPSLRDNIMDPAEQAQMTDYFAEMLAATAKEPVVRFRDLDVATWQRLFKIPDDVVQGLLAADDERHGHPADNKVV